MKSKQLLFLTFCFSLLFTNTFAYDYLRVLNPDWWWEEPGTIEEATISIKPQGLYMEVGLYLTFSARGTPFESESTEQFEIILDFNLPENAIVNDSWLWVEEDIIKGDILDRWTASTIYENIVDRRRDPSILTQNSATEYHLRIYPMLGGSSRKVKISYLVPTDWTANSVRAALPMNILNTSFFPLEEVTFLTYPDDSWKNPRFIGADELSFKTDSQTQIAAAILTNVEEYPGSLSIAFDSPMQDGVYASFSENEGEQYYQMAILPNSFLTSTQTQKLAIVLDYEASNTSLSLEEILSQLEYNLSNQLGASDSFNIIYNRFNPKMLSNHWLPATPEAIQDAIEKFRGELEIDTYTSFLPSLLHKAIQISLDNHTPNNAILVLSSGDQFTDLSSSNAFVREILNLMPTETIPIFIQNFQNKAYQNFWLNGISYSGNGYLYSNLARATGGEERSIFTDNNFSTYFSELITSMQGKITSLDVHTTLENGFCHSRYNINNINNSVYNNQPILQVGKMVGQSPMHIEVAGLYESVPFIKEFKITPQYYPTASLSQMWAGNYIQDLQPTNYWNNLDNNTANEIVTTSIANRVLSYLTAFLCLEPGQGGEICTDCTDETEGEVVAIEEATTLDSLVQIIAAPNPFQYQTTITIQLTDDWTTNDIDLKIYDALGRSVFTFTPKFSSDNSLILEWNGKDASGLEVNEGVYFLIVQTPKGQVTYKLLKVG